MLRKFLKTQKQYLKHEIQTNFKKRLFFNITKQSNLKTL